ncbi:DUF5360 family protein [Sphingomonas sp. Y38-1Y]|uniref:DUF5360 family protein n=1 Tax=Sphingomonas sp. Y38-1Y TaxID=3078265 RepID=UPI0028F02A78|nr:DUF5360 family protein [Sphingomonas sp. Y38-1Y]
MSRRLAAALLVTDLAFLVYWSASTLQLVGVANAPADMMYADYVEPRVVAWNWSFLPLDFAFVLTGLAALSASRGGLASWRTLAIVSLTLTATAGGMAVSYWTLLAEFDPAWFLPNLAILLWPFAFLPDLVRQEGALSSDPSSPARSGDPE